MGFPANRFAFHVDPSIVFVFAVGVVVYLAAQIFQLIGPSNDSAVSSSTNSHHSIFVQVVVWSHPTTTTRCDESGLLV